MTDLNRLRSLVHSLNDEGSESQRLMRGFVDDRRMTEVADYVKRGRRFAGYADEVVCLVWVEAFKREPTSQIESDLAAELQLRKLQPPLHLVETELRAIASAFTSALERGELDEERCEELMAAIADYQARLAKLRH